jgi:hypothetical protein
MILSNIDVAKCFKMNLQNIMTNHLINQSLRKQVFIEIINDSDIMKHLVENRLDIFYLLVLSGSFMYVLKDKEWYKPYIKSENSFKSLNLRHFDILLLIIISVLCKNIENAI